MTCIYNVSIHSDWKRMQFLGRQVLAHNLQPALQWTKEHREELRASNGDAAVSTFEFRLHRLQFLHTLQIEGQSRRLEGSMQKFNLLVNSDSKKSSLLYAGPSKALAYARTHFAGFQESEMGEIQRLMGCLCFVRRPGSSPYADLMAPAQWSEVAREFSRQCCGLLGQVNLVNTISLLRN